MNQNLAFLMDETDDMKNLISLLRNKDLTRFLSVLNGLDLHFLSHATYEGYTIMQHSVLHGYHDFVDALLSFHVNPNVGDGWTKPVLLAASYGYWKILKSFMDTRWQKNKKVFIRFDVWTDPAGENILHLGTTRIKVQL